MSRPLCFTLIKGLVALISLIYRKVLFPNKVSPTPTICNNHSPVWMNPHPFWQLKIHCIFLDLLKEKDQASATSQLRIQRGFGQTGEFSEKINYQVNLTNQSPFVNLNPSQEILDSSLYKVIEADKNTDNNCIMMWSDRINHFYTN